MLSSTGAGRSQRESRIPRAIAAVGHGESRGRSDPGQRRAGLRSGHRHGKTFGYLVPALLSAGKVILSTGTKTLQDQLYHRDLPTVRAALNVP